MGKMGFGYGSEWHLLRYLAYHRDTLNQAIEAKIGLPIGGWLDFPFVDQKRFRDAEWKGVDFLPDGHPAKKAWLNFWPQTGNVQNWDAVGWLEGEDGKELLLVEAKAHLEEVKSNCGAKENSRSQKAIVNALDAAKVSFGAPSTADWMHRYYQFCNRLTVLHFLHDQGVKARLLFLYFCGDAYRGNRTDRPQSAAGWAKAINDQEKHVGIDWNAPLSGQVSKLCLPITLR